jgi:hypothetical protein
VRAPREHKPSCPLATRDALASADRHLYHCTCWFDGRRSLTKAEKRTLRAWLAEHAHD